jgi:hypothetical protein
MIGADRYPAGMGAWGSGIFDNDDAADWVAELSANGLGAVETALGNALAAEYLEAPDGARALAAADVVARLRFGGGEESAYAQGVLTWLEQNRISPSPDLVEQALSTIARVRGDDSELRELWADAGDALEDWRSVLADVEARLTA